MQHRYVSKFKCYEPDVVRRRSNCIQQQTQSTTNNTQLAYAVYDDETGKMMEIRELRNHQTERKEKSGIDRQQMNMTD